MSRGHRGLAVLIAAVAVVGVVVPCMGGEPELGVNLPLVSDQGPGRMSGSMPSGAGWQVPPEAATYTIRAFGDRSATSPVAVTAAPRVEVSYDVGTTWHQVRLTDDHDRWEATVDHPKDATFVSLPASVADREDDSTKHTIIRAYALT